MDITALASAVAEQLRENQAFDVGLLEFHETLRSVDWKRILREAREHIDIVVYYYDSWVNSNWDDLVGFFQRPKTSIRLFLADPEINHVLDEVWRLFPEYSKEVVREKIVRTGQRIREAAKSAGAAEDRVQVLFVQHTLSYSAQVIDHKRLMLGIFEMNRKQKIDSPAFVIDISKNKHLEAFISKEIDGLLEKSRKA